MTFQKFLKQIDDTFHTSSYKAQLRYGQYIMNELYNIWPEKYAQITGTEYDCFYDNDLANSTLKKLEREWHEYIRT